MIREFRIADLFTLGNGFSGAAAMLAFMRFLIDGGVGYFWVGTAFLPLALAMDILDGRIARRLHMSSPFGQELDSLADAVSFGVAPAAMAFAAGMRGGWDAVCLVAFVGCGISRLARYNVTAEALAGTGHWQEALPLGSVTLGPFVFHPLALVYLAHGAAMVSKTLRIPKL